MVKDEDYTEEENNNRLMAGALMLLAGGILGAGIALLYAPQSGQKTRKDICRIAKRARRKAEDAVEVVEEFSENVSDMVEAVGDRANEIIHKSKGMAYGAKRKILRALEEGEDMLQKQRSRLAKLVG